MKIKYLVLSDIHLGHNINKTENIIQNLNKFFLEYRKELKDLNIIFIAGDTFDRLLMSSGKEYISSLRWLVILLTYCKDNNISLRILEGTPSHDWRQIKTLTSIIEELKLEVDYKYIDTLYIEHMNKYNLNILYIPDEYKPTALQTYKEVLKLLKKHKLEQVDIGIFHGQFNYQLPIILPSSHSEEDYLKIVKYYINIGHIHTHSVRDRILAQGSFDRLVHGEEEDKGGVLVEIDTKSNNISYKFLVNKYAMIFKTYKFSNESIDKIIKILDKDIKKLPVNSNIRLYSDSEVFINKNMDTLRKRYPMLNIKFEKKKESNKFSLIEEEIVIDSFSITKDNIKELLTTELNKYNLNKEQIDIFNNTLQDVMNN